MRIDFKEELHPRGGKGSAAGGKFVAKGGSSEPKKTPGKRASAKQILQALKNKTPKSLTALQPKWESIENPKERKLAKDSVKAWDKDNKRINKSLRTGAVGNTEIQQHIRGLDIAFDKAGRTLAKDITVFRAVSGDFASSLKLGAKWSDKGFSTTTNDVGSMAKAPAVLVVTVSKGMKVLSDKNSLLLPRDTHWEVIGQKGNVFKVSVVDNKQANAKTGTNDQKTDTGRSEDPGQATSGREGAGRASDAGLSRAFSRASVAGAGRGGNVSVWHSGNSVFNEIGGKEGAQAFHAAISSAKTGEFSASVHVYSPDEYKAMRLFLSPDGLTGFALKGDDIVSVFKHPSSKAKKVAEEMLKLAVENGGRRLDAFDTQLPRLYSKAGFKAVARLKWNEEFIPDGWKKDTYSAFNKGEPDVVFMVHDPKAQLYVKGEGKYVKDYDEGNAEQRKLAPSVEGYKPGTRGRGRFEVESKRDEWVASSSIKSMEDIIAAAPIAQVNFAEAGQAIAKELGIEFKDPGPKTSSAKGIERTQQKIDQRKGVVARVTDTARGAFILTAPDQADQVIQMLGKTHEVLAEPWRTIEETGYTDRALLFRDKQTGLIGEVQLIEPKMLAAKMDRGGHEMYEKGRVMEKGPEKDKLFAQMQQLYGGVLDSYKGTPWEMVDGRDRFMK